MNLLGFFKPGIWELLIILLIVLLLFGATKLPQIGKAMGEAIRGFKKSANIEEKDDFPPSQTPPSNP